MVSMHTFTRRLDTRIAEAIADLYADTENYRHEPRVYTDLFVGCLREEVAFTHNDAIPLDHLVAVIARWLEVAVTVDLARQEEIMEGYKGAVRHLYRLLANRGTVQLFQ